MAVHKSSPIFPTILMHLMMAKLAETCCVIVVLNKDIQLETSDSFKILKFEY
jgi:hypothetical protein